MRKFLAIILAAMFVLSLFAACGDKGSTTSPSPASTTNTTTTGDEGGDENGNDVAFQMDVPEKPHAGDTLAVDANGNLKYELDGNGFPLATYEYTLPLTTDDHSYSYWGTTLVGITYLPAEGPNVMEYYSWLRDNTGVHLDYTVKTGDELQTSFSLMMASDEFYDICVNAGAYFVNGGGGTAQNMIDEGFFINIADYMAYAPNFRYIEPSYNMDPELHNAIWLNDTMITSMGFLIEQQTPGTGWVARGDWLERLGIEPLSIHSYAQFEDMLTRMKNEIISEIDYGGANIYGYPYLPSTTVEALGNHLFGGMNTGMQLNTSTTVITPQLRVVPKAESTLWGGGVSSDRVVTVTFMEDIDYEALQFFLDWQEKGLLNPDFEDLTEDGQFKGEVVTGRAGVFTANPSTLDDYEKSNVDPNAKFVPLYNPTKSGVWDSKFGNDYRSWGYFNGYGWSYSTTAPNIPLLVSYGDYFYSDSGSTVGTWGIEGLTYEVDDAGNFQLTDFVLNNDKGLSSGLFICLYSQNPFAEPIKQNHLRSYAYPGGERYVEMFEVWSETAIWKDRISMDAHWNWPSNDAKATQEQSSEIDSFIGDARTKMTEEYWKFLNNITPLTRDAWDAYVKDLRTIGYDRYQMIMQQVYEDYMARR